MTVCAFVCACGGLRQRSPRSTRIPEFYAKNFDNSYMEHRFQSMTITPEDSSRVDSSKVAEAVGQPSA